MIHLCFLSHCLILNNKTKQNKTKKPEKQKRIQERRRNPKLILKQIQAAKGYGISHGVSFIPSLTEVFYRGFLHSFLLRFFFIIFVFCYVFFQLILRKQFFLIFVSFIMRICQRKIPIRIGM